MQEVRDALGEVGFDRVGRLADLPGLHELRRVRPRQPRRGRSTRRRAGRSSSQALEPGINFFDTANVYSDGTSEEITGRALADFANRDEIVVATKVHGRMRKGPNGAGLSRKAILAEIDNSLRRLGMDYVDLYQIHRFDPTVPVEETMEALHDVVKAGKARYIGASSMYAWQFSKMQYVAEANGWTPFVSMQDHYNLLYREEEREMLPLCVDLGVGVIPWSPLARGRLTRDVGRRRRRAARPTSSAGRSTSADDERSSTPSPRSPRAAASAGPRSRWRGCRATRPSTPRSSGRRSPSTSPTPWRPSTSS